MNDDPTQLFPETHWKRYATEPVSVPVRGFGRVTSAPNAQPEASAPSLPVFGVKQLLRLPTQPSLS